MLTYLALIATLLFQGGKTIDKYPEQRLRFAHIADLHVSPGTGSEKDLVKVVDDINRTDVSFVIVNGDLTNTGSDAELTAVRNILSRLKKRFYVVPGNHETNWSESAGLYFNSLWNGDRFIFRRKGFVFAGFNTGPFMKMGDGQVKKEDLRWLDASLGRARRKDDIVVSFAHYPLDAGLSNWFEAAGVLHKYGCMLAFCGHGHRLTLMNFDGITGIMGRAVLTGNSQAPGYNIVELSRDSVWVFNKEPGKNRGNALLSARYSDGKTISDIPSVRKPDYSVNDHFSGSYEITEKTGEYSVFTGPLIASDTLLVLANSGGFISAEGIKTGKPLWTRRLAAPVYSTPVAGSGIIALGTVDGYLLGLRIKDGKTAWKVAVGRPVLAEGVVDGDTLFIGGGDKAFYKINIRSGQVLWVFTGIGGLVQGKPALSAGSVVFGAWDRHLYSLGRKTGTLQWKWNNGKPQQLYSPGNITPVIANGRVFIVAPDRYMTALNLGSGKEVWRTGRHMVRESMGKSPDGSHIYAKLMNDTLISVSARAAGPLTEWSESLSFGYEHNPCRIEATPKMVLCGTRAGEVIAADPVTGKLLWRYKAGNSSVNGIVADSSGSVWLTLIEGRTIKLHPK